jgi:hypothetical protein
MVNVVRLPVRPSAKQGVIALCARLRHIEAAESPDEAMMDTIAEAEQDVLVALVGTRSNTLAEAERKFATITDRADAADGVLSDLEMAVLRSALNDLRRFDPTTAAA